ncbi:MAG: hypothetical protein QGF46_06550, partial [Planctomycetota bacterium]|nr:hypothetical protein [Planctomycetota bacterium]
MLKRAITLLLISAIWLSTATAQVADVIKAPFVVPNIQVWQSDGSFIEQHLLVLSKEDVKFLNHDSDLSSYSHLPQIDAEGFLYPGMINASFSSNRGERPTNSFAAQQSDPTQGPITHMELGGQNAYAAHTRIADYCDWDDSQQEQWRQLGFSSAYLTPASGILQGKAAHIAFDGQDLAAAIIEDNGLDFASLYSNTGEYPGTPMSALAVLRQILLLQNSDQSYPAIDLGNSVVVRANSAREIENFLDLQRDYDQDDRAWVIYGGRDAYLHIDRILAQRVAVLYQIDFDEQPKS